MSTPVEVMNFIYARMVEHHGENPNVDYIRAFHDIIQHATDEDWASKDISHIRSNQPNKAEEAAARYMQGYGPRGKAFLLSIKREPPRNYRLIVEGKVDLGNYLTKNQAIHVLNAISKVVRELRPLNVQNSVMYVVEFIEGATVDICSIWDYHVASNSWHQEVIRHIKEKDHVETDEIPTE